MGGRTVALVQVMFMVSPVPKNMVPFCPGWFMRVPTITSFSFELVVGMVPLSATKVVL